MSATGVAWVSVTHEHLRCPRDHRNHSFRWSEGRPVSKHSASHLHRKGAWLVFFYLRSSICVHTMTMDPL